MIGKKPKRIVIVDDEPKNLELLEAYLEPMGHEIVRALNGRECIEVYDQGAADLILLDLMMPEVDGFAVLAHIKKIGGAVNDTVRDPRLVPVIVLTASNERERRLRALNLGADEFLEKPLDRAILLARVCTLLKLKDSTDMLMDRNASLERLQRKQREFTSFLVHDFKGPLSAVSANITWAREQLSAIDKSVDGALLDAGSAAERLLELVTDLLMLSQVEDIELPSQRKLTSVAPMLRDVTQWAIVDARRRHITVELSSPEHLAIRADMGLLRRAVENLVRNAIDHTPRGGRIAVSAREGAHFEIRVSNTGLPIPPERRELVFEKFERGMERPEQHFGVGLYFCKCVAEAHGGSIKILEQAEWPTSFVLRLPNAAYT